MDSRPLHQEQKRQAIKTAEAWRKPGIEPKLDDILSEPLVLMMMQRDGVTTHDIQEMMRVMPTHPNKLALTTTQGAP